jgi:hypothetical protein
VQDRERYKVFLFTGVTEHPTFIAGWVVTAKTQHCRKHCTPKYSNINVIKPAYK